MTILSHTSIEQIRNFLTGETGLSQLYEWLVEVEYDSTLSEEERNALAQVRLTVLDVRAQVATEQNVYELVDQVLRLVGDSNFASASNVNERYESIRLGRAA